MKTAVRGLLLLYCIHFLPFYGYAQEEVTFVEQGKKYIDLNIKSLSKLNHNIERQQKNLLNKLQRQEKRFASKLKRKDSAAHAQYTQQAISFDSIGKLRQAGPSKTTAKITGKPAAAIDSLTAIQSFLEKKIHLQGESNNNAADLIGYDSKLVNLKTQQNYSNYINELIGQRTNNLKSINASAKGVSGFKSIDKQVYYAKEKMKVFKQISDQPSVLEDDALEMLQGQEGFEQYMQKATGNDMSSLNGLSTSDLEKMGYQTKRQVNQQLQQKFGNNLTGLQQNVSNQIKAYQDKTKKLTEAAKTAKQSKHSLQQLRRTDKPTFKVNPMRGLPFSRRVEKQYNWQTTRATIDGAPAMLQASAMAGFRHTPRLTYGIGMAASVGLGTSWNNIRISFEGIGLRSYAEWKWQYGIGVYAGYERMYKQAAFIDNKEVAAPERKLNPHNTSTYNEAVLIGLAKTYKVNDKWNGSFQVLYDVWWKEKGLKSPIILRLATIKK